MASMADNLGDRFIRHSIDLQRLEAHERRVVLKMLNRLQQDILAMLAADAATHTDNLTLAQSRRLEALFVTVEETIRTSYKQIASQQRASLIKIGEFESAQTEKIVNTTVGVSLMTVGVPLVTIKAMVDGDTVLGLPAKDWWAKQATNLKAAFQDTIRRGMFAGETLNDLARRVRGTRESGFSDGIMGGATRGARRNAEALIRTSVQSIANSARYETLRANDDVIGGQTWISVLDNRTSTICQALSQQSWDMDGNKLDGTELDFPGPPPIHFNCFPGDTLVTSSDQVTGKSQRWYEGDLIVLHTASGQQLSCTPNHPILTRNGWVPAHLLKKGHDVIRSLRPEWEVVRFRHMHNDDVPTRIENCPVSTFSSLGVQSHEVPITAEDFHGDVLSSKVAIITIDGQLWNEMQSSRGQHDSQVFFGRRLLCPLGPLSPVRHLNSMGVSLSRPSHCIMGGLRQSRSLSWCHAGMSHQHSLTARANRATSCHETFGNQFVANPEVFCENRSSLSRSITLDNLVDRKFNESASRLNAGSLQSAPDARQADAMLARQIMSGQTGPISLDQIVRIDHQRFHGYVYNLQTVNMCYMANSIIVHNCRSTLVPMLKSWEQLATDAKGDEKLGRKLDRIEGKIGAGTQASMNGQIAADVDYETWLKGRSETEQKEILGPGKWGLWQKGKIGLTDLIDQRGHPRTLEQLKTAV